MPLRVAGPHHAVELARLAGLTDVGGWGAASVERHLASPTGLGRVWTESSRFVGFVLGTVVVDEGSLDLLVVAPRWRRRGIGARLVEAFHEAVVRAGARTIHLEVAENNQAALRLYRSRSYRCVGRRPRYYADGNDALIMGRDLDVGS